MADQPNLSENSSGDFAANINASLQGWDAAMNIHFVRATADEVVAEVEIGPMHRQPYGIVHGGVHSGLVEAVTSIGAALAARRRGQSVVGLENHTSFLNAVREGKLRATARSLPSRTAFRNDIWFSRPTTDWPLRWAASAAPIDVTASTSPECTPPCTIP